MTYYIREDSTSSLQDGIETLVIPIHDPRDIESLVFHTQRGGVYDVVEWLTTTLGRDCDFERVCGLSVRQQGNTFVVNLEMRQPGKQLEKWLSEYLSPGLGRFLTMTNSGKEVQTDGKMVLCERALSQEKFSDKYKPWWEGSDVAEELNLEEAGANQ